MKHYFNLGLIGYPLEHSLSPQIQRAALRAAGLAGEYRLYPTPPVPRGTAGLVGLISRLRSGEISGLNVTIPHKQAVLPLLDELTPTARKIGAVNTLYLQDGRILGDNTDLPAFWGEFTRLLGPHGVNGGRPHHALVLGAGGAARAVVYALAQAGWQVTIAARRTAQAADLLAGLDVNGAVLPLAANALADLTGLDALVNTTPVGMSPLVKACPWPAEIDLPANTAVYDLIYNPYETALLRRAGQAGLKSAGGLGMLVEQAALAFNHWTNSDVPREPLWAAVQNFIPHKEVRP